MCYFLFYLWESSLIIIVTAVVIFNIFNEIYILENYEEKVIDLLRWSAFRVGTTKDRILVYN